MAIQELKVLELVPEYFKNCLELVQEQLVIDSRTCIELVQELL